MHENPQQDLFGIRLNEAGIYYIRKTARLLILFYILLVLLSGLSFGIILYSIVRYSNVDHSWSGFLLRGNKYLGIAITLINLFGVYYYTKFFRLLNRSLDQSNELLFNRAFRYIHLNALVFISVMILNIVYEGIVVFILAAS